MTATHRTLNGSPQALKRAIELKAFYWAVGGLYFIQNNVTGGRDWGFCNSSYPTTNPALAPEAGRSIPPGPYTLRDFGTASFGGDQTVAGRLYANALALCAAQLG